MCDHEDAYWKLATNEDGWECVDCGQPMGWRPDLDRSHTYEKVRDILLDLHEGKFIYVSNGTMGDVIADNVVHRCLEEDTYDQYSIIRFILEDKNYDTHAGFWRTRAERFLMGAEPIRPEQRSLFGY